MMDFKDRVPQNPGRRKITYADGRVEYVTVEMADNATVQGTALNRAAFMALQGFQASTTIWNADGTATETFSNGDSLKSEVGADGVIKYTFTAADGSQVILKSAFFNGTISNEVIE